MNSNDKTCLSCARMAECTARGVVLSDAQGQVCPNRVPIKVPIVPTPGDYASTHGGLTRWERLDDEDRKWDAEEKRRALRERNQR